MGRDAEHSDDTTASGQQTRQTRRKVLMLAPVAAGSATIALTGLAKAGAQTPEPQRVPALPQDEDVTEWRPPPRNRPVQGSSTSSFDAMDYRFPEMYRESVPGALAAFTGWVSGYVERKTEQMIEHSVFPFTSFEKHSPIEINSADSFRTRAPRSLEISLIDRSDFDILESIETRMFRPAQVTIFYTIGRYNLSGERVTELQGMSSVQRSNDNWKVWYNSFIGRDGRVRGVEYPETISNATRLVTHHMKAYGDRDQRLLDEVWLRQPGERTTDFDAFAQMAGSKVGGYAYSQLEWLNLEQHGESKAHCENIFSRRKSDGSLISLSHGTYIAAKVNGRWGLRMAGFGATQYDASNDEKK